VIGFNDYFWRAVRLHRDKLILAAHWAPSNHPLFSDAETCQRSFESVLAQVGNDYVEVGMLTLVGVLEGSEEVQRALECLQHFKEQGRIGYIGMSSHGISQHMIDVNSGLIDVLMIPINLTDLIKPGSEEKRALYQACVKKGVGLVAMKPYWGGGLLSQGITPTQCLAYVLFHPVSTTVPGISNVEHLQAALHYLEATDGEKDYHPAVGHLPAVWRGVCLNCNHCLPCPQGIFIGEIIQYAYIYAGLPSKSWTFDELSRNYATFEVKASECTECGVCMERCPFEVDIITRMREVAEIFEVKDG